MSLNDELKSIEAQIKPSTPRGARTENGGDIKLGMVLSELLASTPSTSISFEIMTSHAEEFAALAANEEDWAVTREHTERGVDSFCFTRLGRGERVIAGVHHVEGDLDAGEEADHVDEARG